MPERVKIFAYGSLINVGSLKWTAPDADNIFPAKVFGFGRSFCLASSYRFDSESGHPVCVLNVELGSDDDCINGICFDIDSNDFAALCEREKFYSLQEVKIHNYHAMENVHQGYIFMAEGYDSYGFLPGSSEQQDYLRLCLAGCKVYGREFVREFRTTIGFWGIEDQDDVKAIWEGSF